MRTVREHLPDVLSRGRPSKAAIASSPIGALNFSSWRAMCEAPVANGGLGLPWSTWRQWSRAWSVVLQHHRLQEAPLTAAEINRIAAEAKASGEPMPHDADAIEAFQERQAERKKAAREETQTALKQRVEALEADLAVSREEQARTAGVANELREQLAAAQARREEVQRALERAEREKDEALRDLRAVQEQLEDHKQRQEARFQQQRREIQDLQQQVHNYAHRSLLERIVAVFSP
ncbi:MAG: hypothetical protein LC667_05650 [Thioalkalivibrio sp.]|nr:hypothetical protein [Thioalkalivibrio sp.]